MTSVRYTRDLFLRGICVVYVFAFSSLFIQIPGLYGVNGVLPARSQLDLKGTDSMVDRLNYKPTLLWFASHLGLDTETMMDLLALIGIIVSFAGFASQSFCTAPALLLLWVLYFSLYQVGQTFMWFQWDILLLEAGFLSILLAPLWYRGKRTHPADNVMFFLVRWLYFRLMFSSGVVKLISGCPTWWGLTALNYHFESQCIPTPLAWYAHQLPHWFLELTTVFSLILEIFVPFLFFFPVRSVRIVAFYLQLFLQLNIIITGNYNFFNILTIVLSLSLLDDRTFYKDRSRKSGFQKFVSSATCLIVYGLLLVASVILFNMKISPSGIISCKIGFSQEEFDDVLYKGIILSIVIASAYFLVTIFKGLFSLESAFSFRGLATSLCFFAYTFAAVSLFTISFVPYTSMHAGANYTVNPKIRAFHSPTERFHLVNSYGLFRRMTGVGGRPEVIIEGANSLEGPWEEYHFLYKPGNVNNTLPFVSPHQPRLDWQMWFAALGTYHQNPWLMSLAYRLLHGQPEVLQLLDNTRNPFPNKPPKYLRATLYTYHYTTWNQREKPSWWSRTKVSEYFPIFSRDHPPLLDYLSKMKILGSATKEASPSAWIKLITNSVRSVTGQFEPSILMVALFITGCLLATTVANSVSSPPPSRKKTKKH